MTEDIRAKVAYYGLAEVMLEVKGFLKVVVKKLRKELMMSLGYILCRYMS